MSLFAFKGILILLFFSDIYSNSVYGNLSYIDPILWHKQIVNSDKSLKVKYYIHTKLDDHKALYMFYMQESFSYDVDTHMSYMTI